MNLYVVSAFSRTAPDIMREISSRANLPAGGTAKISRYLPVR
jgi:hypothetical protein